MPDDLPPILANTRKLLHSRPNRIASVIAAIGMTLVTLGFGILLWLEASPTTEDKVVLLLFAVFSGWGWTLALLFRQPGAPANVASNHID